MNTENIETPKTQMPDDDDRKFRDPKMDITPSISPTKAAFISLVAVFLIYQIGGAILTLAIFGLNFEQANVNAMRLLTMGGQILLILLPALLLSKLVYEDVTTILRVNKAKIKEFSYFILGLVILTPLFQSYINIQNFIIERLAAAFPLINSVKSFLDKLDKLVESTYSSLLAVNSVPEAMLVIIVIALVPALCEETFFRGFVQSSFEFNFKPWQAALITALFFGVYHFNPYGLLPLIMLGFYFGFAAYKSGSILIPISLHFLNNFFAVILFFIFGSDSIIENSSNSTEGFFLNIISFILLLLLFVALLFAINRYYGKQRLVSEEI